MALKVSWNSNLLAMTTPLHRHTCWSGQCLATSSLVLACVDAEGKLNLEERRGLYRLRPCSLDLYFFQGHTGVLFPACRDQSGPKGCHAALPQISCKSVQPVPARVEEPFSPVRQSSSGGDTRSRSFPICPKPARESKAVETDLKSVRIPP